MPFGLMIPLKVMGIGIVISYGIAALIKVLTLCINKLSKNKTDEA